jgi:hypothetical protein
MTMEMDTEKGSAAIGDGSLQEFMRSTMEAVKPEAAYFGARNGKRTAFVVFDLVDTADIPRIAEPFFMKLGAKIDFTPVMDLSDVQSGLERFGGAR